ncbi:MAG: hypothetical protein QM504_19110 [Pseudomonadota bacterium]
MSDSYDIEPLTRSTVIKPLVKRNPDHKEKKDKKEKHPAKNKDEDIKDTSSKDDDQGLSHVDEFV